MRGIQRAGVILSLVCVAGLRAQLTNNGGFSAGSSVGVAFDASSGFVWTYPDFGAQIRKYSAAGTLVSSFARPGEAANDADLEFTAAPMTLGATSLPKDTLLFINGETGVAEVYAIDKNTGSVLATLVTGFGSSHIVGGAHHPQRGTLFLVQDKVPGGTIANRIAEVDPTTGAVLATFLVTDALASFTVNYGDIDIAKNGNILVVSSDESTILELTPTGAFVATHALPSGVSALAGIGVDDNSCSIWTTSNGGSVRQLDTPYNSLLCPLACDSIDYNNDASFFDPVDIDAFLSIYGEGPCIPAEAACNDIDFNNDGSLFDPCDIDSFLLVFSEGPCTLCGT
jgi:hypothetical protein